MYCEHQAAFALKGVFYINAFNRKPQFRRNCSSLAVRKSPRTVGALICFILIINTIIIIIIIIMVIIIAIIIIMVDINTLFFQSAVSGCHG